MKTLGRIAYEKYCNNMFGTKIPWPFIEQAARDTWEDVAEEVVKQYKEREPEEEESHSPAGQGGRKI